MTSIRLHSVMSMLIFALDLAKTDPACIALAAAVHSIDNQQLNADGHPISETGSALPESDLLQHSPTGRWVALASFGGWLVLQGGESNLTGLHRNFTEGCVAFA